MTSEDIPLQKLKYFSATDSMHLSETVRKHLEVSLEILMCKVFFFAFWRWIYLEKPITVFPWMALSSIRDEAILLSARVLEFQILVVLSTMLILLFSATMHMRQVVLWLFFSRENNHGTKFELLSTCDFETANVYVKMGKGWRIVHLGCGWNKDGNGQANASKVVIVALAAAQEDHWAPRCSWGDNQVVSRGFPKHFYCSSWDDYYFDQRMKKLNVEMLKDTTCAGNKPLM